MYKYHTQVPDPQSKQKKVSHFGSPTCDQIFLDLMWIFESQEIRILRNTIYNEHVRIVDSSSPVIQHLWTVQSKTLFQPNPMRHNDNISFGSPDK